MKKLLLLLSLMLSAITTWATPQGYAELAVNNGKAWGASDARYTLTFRYGEMPSNTATAHYYDAENTPRITNMTDYHDVEDWQVFGDIWFQRTPDTVNAGKHLPLYYITHAVFEPSFANARPKSTAFWFFTGNCDLWTAQVSELISIEGLEYLNTSEVTHMEMMFGGCNRLTSIDVSHFDTSKVTDMTNMFIGCQVCRSLDVSNWDTSNVTTMSAMFFACQRLASVDVSNWDVSNVEDMYAMFNECRKLESIDVSNWNTSKVEDMHGIFSNCQSLTSLDVSNLDLSGITNNSSCITWYNLPALQTLTVGDVSECAFWLGRGKSFPGLQNLTFTDATSFLANRAIAETFLNNLKTASPNVQIVLDCELTPA